MQPTKKSAPAPRMAALDHFTLPEEAVVISASMLDRLCNRVEFLRAFAYLNTMSRRKIWPKAGGNHFSFISILWRTGNPFSFLYCRFPTSDRAAPLLQRRMTADRHWRGEISWR